MTIFASYYKWLNHPKSSHELANEKISAAIQEIYKEHPDKGHRRIRDDLEILYYRFEVWRCQRTIDRCNWVISICQRIERWMGGSEDTRWKD